MTFSQVQLFLYFAKKRTMIAKFSRVAVVGAGTMGNGIAHVLAQFGYEVNLIDLSTDVLEQAVKTIGGNMDRQIKKEKLTSQQKEASMARIHTFSDMVEGVRDRQLVVEVATEKESLKKELFQQIDRHAPTEAILATNTSSISITRLASVTKRTSQVIGMHFMNPVPVMKLVEIIRGYDTADSVAVDIQALAEDLEKVPVIVQDFPGFVSNRILMPMINEAIYTLYEGVADAEAIDTVMKLGMAHPMGPLTLADFIGLDVCLSILEVLYQGFANPKYAPCPLLKNMVAAGHLGKKLGKGFYVYD